MPLAGVITIVLGLVAALALASCVAVIAVRLWQTSTAWPRSTPASPNSPTPWPGWSRPWTR